MACAIVLAFPASANAGLKFSPGTQHGTFSGPSSVASADFNRDGNPDLAVASQGSNLVSIKLGNGAGGFTTSSGQSTDGPPVAVAAGDLNNDLNPDLVVAIDGLRITRRLGDGNGGFGPETTLVASTFGINTLALGDINNDGKLDFVWTRTNSNPERDSLGRALGDGTGNQVLDGILTMNGTDFRGIATGDLNGDGTLDVALADVNGRIRALLGAGNGSFSTSAEVITPGATNAVAIGDVNGDGRADVAGTNGNAANASVALGNGNGTFGTSAEYPVGADPSSVRIGDLNADGRGDLAVTNSTDATVSVLASNSSTGFSNVANLATGPNPQSVLMQDLNGDGRPDLVDANRGAGDVSVFLNEASASFALTLHQGVGDQPQSLAVRDFDADGKPDVAVANRGSDTVTILKGLGNGSFTEAGNPSANPLPSAIESGDFNNDGKPDLAVANPGAVSLLRNAGGSGFDPAAGHPVNGFPGSIAVGDLNGDGNLDLGLSTNSPDGMAIRLGDGEGAFASEGFYDAGTAPYSLRFADVNGDANLDAIMVNVAADRLALLLGQGDGTFGLPQFIDLGPRGTVSAVAVGDLNGDGKPDLAFTSYPDLTSGFVSTLLGDGQGGFTAPLDFEVGSQPSWVAIGDLNGDGKPDVATSNRLGTASVLTGRGDGTLTEQTGVGIGQDSRQIELGDLNLDGRADLVTADVGSNRISMVLNAGRPGLSAGGDGRGLGAAETGLDFGKRAVGHPTPRKLVRLWSAGEARLEVDEVKVVGANPADFTVAADQCSGESLPVGTSCTVEVGFNPGAAGTRTASLRISDGGPDTPQVIKLSGLGDPLVPDVALEVGPLDGAHINNTTPSWSLTSSDPAASFRCRVDGASFSACASPYVTPFLNDGPHTVRVKAVSASGAESEVLERTVTVDTLVPEAQIASGPPQGSVSNDRSPHFTFTSSDDGASFDCSLDSGPFGACSSPNAPTGLADGAHTFSVRATDRAGNTSPVVSRSWSIDTVPPAISIAGRAKVRTKRRAATVAFSIAAAKPAVLQCRVDLGAFAACGSNFRTPKLKRGRHTLTVMATDGVGNVGTAAKGFRIVRR